MNKTFSPKQVVAIAIGAAIFFVLSRFLAIPTLVPNTTINIAYGFLALFAGVFGAIPATLAAFIGHFITDLTYGGAWYSYIIASAFVGGGLGVVLKQVNIEKGQFTKSDGIRFVIGQAIVNAIAWLVVAPGLDILIYQQPVEIVMAQVGVILVTNIIGTGIVGYLLLKVYASTRTQSGSLSMKK